MSLQLQRVTAQDPEPGVAPDAVAAAPRRGRLRALDGLRLVAALMVCFYHYAGRGGDAWKAWGQTPALVFPELSKAAVYGPLGVQIFFVISGFVICMSGWGRTLKSFAVSRATRLYPAYWAAVLLVTAVFALPGVVWKTVSPSDLLTNMTMLQMPVGADRVLGVCWTLWAELRFYLLFALAVVLPGATRRRVLAFCGLWTVGAVLADASGGAFLKTVLMPEYAPFFIGGIGIYLVYRFGHDPLSWGVVAVGWLFGQHYAVKGLIPHAHAAHVFQHRSETVIIVIVTLGFAAVAAVTLLPRVAAVDWRWLTTAGILTYPFYLVHEHLGWVVIFQLHQRLHLSPYAVLALTAGSMLVLAWLLHRLVERPLAPRLKRFLTMVPKAPTR
ncbi:acyltransferase family protein [Streptomyces sp. H39-S7]|uniref:acyltransferase family protein n=1 Tax=Streptomyces sp. H39-S7 TaxID=3004357 RepID=UPI0022AF6716|nr:acyltransferase [Streptomyces sp. H39-S7]MCZ4120720.1 acyltransferase [Streptomyces sp. H39-S7]